jgi:hypothetical protein
VVRNKRITDLLVTEAAFALSIESWEAIILALRDTVDGVDGTTTGDLSNAGHASSVSHTQVARDTEDGDVSRKLIKGDKRDDGVVLTNKEKLRTNFRHDGALFFSFNLRLREKCGSEEIKEGKG